MANNYPVGTYKWHHANRTEFDSSQYDSQFKDTPYWDSYQAIINQYANGPEAQWFGFLGADQTNAYNHNQSRMNAINSLLEQKRTDEYNSPEQQAARERAAGLNPDITGVSDVGQTDSASTPNEKEMFYENPIPHIVSFMSMVGNAAIGAQSMIERKLVNDGMRLSNIVMSKDLVLDDLSNFSPFDMEGGDIKPAFKLGYDTGSRSVDKKLEKLSSQLFGSVAHELSFRAKNKDIKKIRKDVFDITSSAGYSDDDDFYSGLATRLADIYQNMLDITNQYEKERLSAIDGSTAGKVANEKNKRSYLNHRFWNESIGLEHGIIKYIKDMAAKGDPAAIDTILNLMGENSSFGGALQKNTLPLSWTFGSTSPFNK